MSSFRKSIVNEILHQQSFKKDYKANLKTHLRNCEEIIEFRMEQIYNEIIKQTGNRLSKFQLYRIFTSELKSVALKPVETKYYRKPYVIVDTHVQEVIDFITDILGLDWAITVNTNMYVLMCIIPEGYEHN